MCIYNTMKRCANREEAEKLYFEYLDRHDENVWKAFRGYGRALATCLGVKYNDLEDLIRVHDKSKRTEKLEIDGYITNFYPYEGDGIGLDEYGIKNAIYEKALLSHYHNNPHHPEYWIFFKHNERKLDCKPMEPIYVCEMLIDWIANETPNNMTVDEYWKHNRGSKFLHINTVDMIDKAIDCIIDVRNRFGAKEEEK